MALYIKRLEIIDEDRISVMVLKDVPIDKGLKKLVNITRVKDGDGMLRKIFKYLDSDYKSLLGVKNGKEMDEKTE